MRPLPASAFPQAWEGRGSWPGLGGCRAQASALCVPATRQDPLEAGIHPWSQKLTGRAGQGHCAQLGVCLGQLLKSQYACHHGALTGLHLHM